MLPYLLELAKVRCQGLVPLSDYLICQDRELEADMELLANRVSVGVIRWSRVSPAMAFFLNLRIQSADVFMSHLFSSGPAEDPFRVAPRWDSRRLKLWLLIDLWARKPDSFLKVEAMKIEMLCPTSEIEPT
jgi:hypothetical protein